MQVSEILKFVQCPECGYVPLVYKEGKINCGNCKSSFEVIENVPIFLKQEKLNKQEITQKKWFEKHYSAFPDNEYKLEKWRESMLNRIFDSSFKNKIKTYLDIGCGATGYTVIESAKRNGWTSFGIDISIEAMVKAKRNAVRERVDENTAFLVCSSENIPLQDKKFDYISMVSILEHLENDQKAVQEASRLLNSPGFLFACVPNAYLRIWPFLWPFYFYQDFKIGHKRHYSIEDLDGLFNTDFFSRYKFFYNGHLIKLFQLILDKFNVINDKKWWEIEKKDINKNSSGLQLNAVYYK